MAGKKLQSAKKKKMINNTIVHIVLAVLAVIWLFPIAWVILTSFRAEKALTYQPSSRKHLRLTII